MRNWMKVLSEDEDCKIYWQLKEFRCLIWKELNFDFIKFFIGFSKINAIFIKWVLIMILKSILPIEGKGTTLNVGTSHIWI
jgi:hypothetical protein